MFTNISKKQVKLTFIEEMVFLLIRAKIRLRSVCLYILLFSRVRLIGPRVIHLETVLIGLPLFAPTSASFCRSGLVSFHKFYIL